MTALHRFVEKCLGITPAGPGQGTQWRYGQNFPWPTWALLLFCVGAAAYVMWVYRQDAGHVARRWRVLLAGLRMAAIAVLLFMLSEAMLTVERTGLPFVVVLLDISGSMGREDQYSNADQQTTVRELLAANSLKDATRFNLGKGILLRKDGAFLKQLLDNHKLRVYTVAESESLLSAPAGSTAESSSGDFLKPQEIDALLPEIRKLEPNGNQTRLGDSLRRVLNNLRGTPPTAVVLLTDGVTTDGEKLSAAARYARQKGVALYAVTLGNSEPVRDVALHDLLADDVAFVDDPVTFTFKLTSSGYAGQRVRLELREKDSNRIIEKREVTLPADGETTRNELTFTPDKPGEFDYVLEAIPLPQETDLKNNREERHLSVRKEKIRILLVDGAPRWEYRELKVLLEREKTVELKTVLQDADPEFSQEDRYALTHFPVKREELFQYDVIILGDVNLTYLSTSVQENLKKFVAERGGGLMLIAGPDFNPRSYAGTPLEALFPIDPATVRIPPPDSQLTEAFHPELTIDGRKGSAIFRFAESEQESQAVWDNFPGLFWIAEAPDLKPGAIVLANHPTRTGSRGKIPLIVMQRFGAGKVLFQATDETWRWRFRTGDLYYGRYWVQAIRYLSRSKLLGRDSRAVLTADREKYQVGEPVQVRLRFLDERLIPTSDDGVTVIVERGGGAQQKVTLARLPEAPTTFEGQLNQLAEGSYHIWVATPSFFDAPPSDDFQVEATLREFRLTRADQAELSQAASVSQGKVYSLADAEQLPRDIPPGLPVPLESGDPLRLWNHWLALTLFVTLLSLEWILRKRVRLV